MQRGEAAPAGRNPAWRVIVPDEVVGFTDGICGEYAENLARDCSDFVVRRSDGIYAYQLAVVVDDALRKQHTFLPKGQVLDEAYITTLPADQQEICNSLNRRTEFRVLKTTYNLY
jgi:hypothetical protein